ncbi:MAG: hypothetical protein ACJ78Y_23495, partial [Myxococcales bacterium]
MKALAVLSLAAALAACGHGSEAAKPEPRQEPAPVASGSTAAAAPPQERMQESPTAPQPPAQSTARTEPLREKPKVKGIEFLALPPSDKPLVTIALRFKGGAADDPKGKAGATLLAARIMSEG